LVVSFDTIPGTRAPPEPVPVESPEVVFGLPLQADKATKAAARKMSCVLFIASFSEKTALKNDCLKMLNFKKLYFTLR
jgi:hypothetical protein